ncbi:hypothetical protein GGR56DRAFT_30168 [Xylariaceae sp. FL0804]|nr:hypothetical protein GGR56DRAFT_30168 [Xylariaceae sp. FL0804]
MASPAERCDGLVRWVEEAGGRLHPAVEVYHDPVTQASLRVRASAGGATVQPGDVVVDLPLSASLSYLNAISGHPDLAGGALPSASAAAAFKPPRDGAYFPAAFLRETPPHVVGRFFLVQQYLLGDASPWWPYVRTLPQPGQMGAMLPLCWPSDDAEFLRGTDAAVAVEEIRATLRREYRRAARLLPESSRFEYALPLYYWAYCVFTSRSFRPSLVLPDADSFKSLPCGIDDFSVLLPLFDIGNHSPLVRTAWTADADAGSCRLQAGAAYAAGDQIFNNYGMKTNAELLLGYGFVFPESADFHNDYIHLKTKADPEAGDLAASHIVSLRPFSDPSSLTGRSRLLDPENLSHCLPCLSHVQDSLVASLFKSVTKGHDGVPDVTVAEIMQGKLPDVLLGQIVSALGAKLSHDLEEMEMHDPEYEAANQNQELALRYREQCKKVLENALRALSAAAVVA